MTLLFDATEAKKFDTRVIERNIQKGFAKAEDYERSLKELPDDSDNAEFINVDTLESERS